MATNAKETVDRLKKQKKKRNRKNVTLSLDEEIYFGAKAYIENQGLTVSEVVEEFLSELLGKR